jgi:FAD:protein FMN transferase
LITPVSRRRFISISAAAGAMACVGPVEAAPYKWQGTALGAKASLLLHHPDKQRAARIVSACVAEINRLENIFSLYREQSALVTLNTNGNLDNPPLELVQALADCRRISDLTGGAFDVTVQPLWQSYVRHFSTANPDLNGPTADAIDAVRKLVDYRNLNIDTTRVSFARSGMAITLNGFAQGFITDRIADLLRSEGLKNVLIDLGETRALDDHPDGRPWRVGVRDPKEITGIVRTLQLKNMALATSGGYGQRFLVDGPQHHLFDPKTGRSSQRYASVTVTAPLAATADALSTALTSLPTQVAPGVLNKSGAIAVHYLHHDGSFEDIRV